MSQYTFALCTYKEKKTEPAEMMQLDGYTVDYIEPASGKLLRLTIESRLSANSLGIEKMCNGYLPFAVSSFASQVMPGQGKLLFLCFKTFLTVELLPYLCYLTCTVYVAADLEGGRHFFNAVKEGDSVLLSCDDENECHLWVMALYRATGQSHKPTPPITPASKNSTISKIQGGKYNLLSKCNFKAQNLVKANQGLSPSII